MLKGTNNNTNKVKLWVTWWAVKAQRRFWDHYKEAKRCLKNWLLTSHYEKALGGRCKHFDSVVTFSSSFHERGSWPSVLCEPPAPRNRTCAVKVSFQNPRQCALLLHSTPSLLQFQNSSTVKSVTMTEQAKGYTDAFKYTLPFLSDQKYHYSLCRQKNASPSQDTQQEEGGSVSTIPRPQLPPPPGRISGGIISFVS